MAFATGVNDQGDVVGGSRLPNNQIHAFLIPHGGTMKDLGVLPGGVSSQATGINNQGQIVGFATTAAGPNHGFTWKNGVMTDLGTLGGTFSQANGVNKNGKVAGFSHTPPS